MTECTFNWRMMRNIFTELHVYDKVSMHIELTRKVRNGIMTSCNLAGFQLCAIRLWKRRCFVFSSEETASNALIIRVFRVLELVLVLKDNCLRKSYSSQRLPYCMILVI
jgi:hypothetical protein